MGLQIRDERQLKALTGLSQAQFAHLLPVFSDIDQTTQQQTYEKGVECGTRTRTPGGGSKGKWPTMADKRLFVLFGRRKDAVFLQRQALLEPCGIRRFSTDGWGAYARDIDPEQHTVGKEHTQKIESKHLNLRTRITRLVRRTLCFSTTTTMHDLVIGLFMNRYEFGRLL
jgi:insertion element IS1 protein InsB